MRVLLVAHEWEAEQPGGAQRSAVALARALSALDGVDVTLASAVERRPDDVLDGRLGAAHGYDEWLVESRTDSTGFRWTDPAYAGGWVRLLNEARPDVVHLHHYFHIGIDLPLLVRRLLPSTPIVLTLHEMLAICLRSGQMVDGHGNLCLDSGIRRCAECVSWSMETVAARDDYVRRGLSDVDVLVTPSEFVRQRYLAWGAMEAGLRSRGRAGGDPPPIRVIANALEFNGFDGARTVPVPHGLRLAFIGQHTPHKGLGVLLDAVAQLSRIAPTALDSLRVYGDGSDRFAPEFHAGLTTALEAGAPLVTVHGRYTQEQLPGILDAADAIVVPSTWWENSPVVIEEALARRVPVICSDIGGMAEKVRDGVDGWHFQAGNAASLAEVLARVATLPSLVLPGMRVPTPLSAVAEAHLAVYEAALREH